MAHDWKYVEPRPGNKYWKYWGCLDLRECRKCGKIQEKHSETAWMRVIGYKWYPKVGRCPADKKKT